MLLGATGAILMAGTFLGPKEELRLEPYYDIGGVKSWCYGQTVGLSKPQYTQAECDLDLVATVHLYRKAIDTALPIGTPPSVQAAMTSVAYNVGYSAFLRDFPGRVALLEGRWTDACDAIVAPWGSTKVKGYRATVKGVPSKGLVNRRWAERELCYTGL